MPSFLSKQLEPLSLLKKVLKLALTVTFAIGIFGLYLVLTPQGAKIALNLVGEFTPYQLTFTSVNGTLVDHLEFTDIEIKGPDLNVKAANLDIGWQLIDLLKEDKSLQYINAKELSIWHQTKEIIPAAAAAPIDKPTLETVQTQITKAVPIPMKIDNIHIVGATIQWNDIEHQLTELTIKHAASNVSKIEEIHYQGTFGTFHAYLQGAIKINWDLQLAQNPYLVQLHSSAVTTKGSVFLPTRQIDDPQNHLQMTLQTKDLRHGKHHLENVALEVKGTLATHKVSLKGHYNNSPIETVVLGQFSSHHWQGKINTLQVKHKRWDKIGNTTGNIKVEWHEKLVHSSISLLLDETYPIKLEAAVEKQKPYALTGTIQTQISNVRSLSSLIPSLSNLRGKMDVDLALNGTILQPQWTGNVVLKEARLRASSLGKKAVLNDLKFSFLPENRMSIHGSGTWGSGLFTITGEGKLFAASPTMIVKLKGEQLLLSDTPEYYIVANPELQLTLKDGAVSLDGKIFIPEAEIQSLKNPDMITPSEDVVIVSKKTATIKPIAEHAMSSRIATNIELALGEKITYKGHGFSTKVKGKLQISQQPGQPPNAKGKLFLLNGKYKAYGKTFDIDYGQILFTGGPIYDPILDIRAQRKIQPQTMITSLNSTTTILAGITFTGNLKTPKIGFYSNPSMPDADVISYLIIGKPQNKMNEAQAELLFEAVSQLAHVVGGQRKDVHFNLAERLKLDQIGFSKKENAIPTPGSHNPLEDTVFVLGKQLSDRLYLNYSVGILDSASQIGMRYVLGKNVMIEAAAGAQGSSADVLLSFEGR